MRILLVDDHQLFSDGLRVLLHELAYDADVITATTIAQALEANGPFDLILLDLHLPDARGIEGLQRVKLRHDDGAVVVVSGDENPAHIRECINHGAMGFVPKASGAAELFEAMRRILSGQTYLPRSSWSGLVAGAQSPVNHEPSHDVHLSPRQHEVLDRLIQGKPNKVIARELGISDATVKTHVLAIFDALGVNNRTEAVYRWAASGTGAPGY